MRILTLSLLIGCMGSTIALADEVVSDGYDSGKRMAKFYDSVPGARDNVYAVNRYLTDRDSPDTLTPPRDYKPPGDVAGFHSDKTVYMDWNGIVKNIDANGGVYDASGAKIGHLMRSTTKDGSVLDLIQLNKGLSAKYNGGYIDTAGNIYSKDGLKRVAKLDQTNGKITDLQTAPPKPTGQEGSTTLPRETASNTGSSTVALTDSSNKPPQEVALAGPSTTFDTSNPFDSPAERAARNEPANPFAAPATDFTLSNTTGASVSIAQKTGHR